MKFFTSVDLKPFSRLYLEERTGYANEHNYNRVKANKEHILQVCQVLKAVTFFLSFLLLLDGLVMLELSCEQDICVWLNICVISGLVLLLTRNEV